MLLAAITMLLLSMGFAGSAVNSSLGGFLHVYTNATATVAYTTSGFAIVQINGGYIIVNTTHYALVSSNATAYDVFKQFRLANTSFNSTIVQNLTAKINQLRHSSAPGFTECFTYTGLNATYLATNSFKGCYNVGPCSSYISKSLYTPSLTIGITNLSKQYNIFNQSYNGYQSIQGKVDSNNYYLYTGQLATYASNIGTMPFTLIENPLFSVPGNFSYALFRNCPIFPSAGTLQNFPWYCSMLGYCRNINFNFSNAYSIQQTAKQLQALPSNSTINSDAKSATFLASSYISAESAKIAKLINGNAMISHLLNASAIGLSQAKSLNLKVSDSRLTSLINELNATSSGIRQAIFTNLTSAVRNLSALVNSTATLTAQLSATYYSAYNLSLQNNAALLSRQLDNPNNAAVQQLVAREGNLSGMFQVQISSGAISALESNLTAVQASIGSLQSPWSISAFVKSIDSWFITPLVSGINESMQARIASAPIYAAVLSFIIGAIALLIVYKLLYHRFNKKHHQIKLKRAPKHVKAAWMRLFIIMLAIVIIYVAITYIFAAGANSWLPIGGLMSRLSASPSVAIAVNSSAAQSNSVASCVASLRSDFTATQKHVPMITVNAFSCVTVNTTQASSTDCLNPFMNAGTPVILITGNSTKSGYRGLYGYVFYANESYSTGANCQLAQLFK